MKNLVIALSLVSSLMIAQSASADVIDAAKPQTQEVETIVVVSKQPVANFEIYSLELAETAIDSMIDVMAESLAAPLSSVSSNLTEVATSLGSSI